MGNFYLESIIIIIGLILLLYPGLYCFNRDFYLVKNVVLEIMRVPIIITVFFSPFRMIDIFNCENLESKENSQ